MSPLRSVPPAGDAVAEQFERRFAEAVARARNLLTSPDDERNDRPGCTAETLAKLITALERWLATEDQNGPWREMAAAHERDLSRLRERYEARFDALNKVHQASARLERHTSPERMLRDAPRTLCEASPLRRCVLSVVREGFAVPEAAYFEGDRPGSREALQALRAAPARLEHPMIDAEIIRRRRATTVTSARSHSGVHRPMAETLGWGAYVAAPLVVAGQVIGLAHADHGPDGPVPGVLDRELLWAFMSGLADAYERASLHRALHREHDQMRQFVDWLSARSNELNAATVAFGAEATDPPPPPGELDLPLPESDDDRAAFEQTLTHRELEVLRLLTQGHSNKGIAAELVVSEATVKFHVVNLLRKLHAKNRAEVVVRYHHVIRARRHAADLNHI